MTITTTERAVSLTRVLAWSVLAMLVFSFVVGAAVLPLRPTDGQFSSWWDGICRAVGVPRDVRTQVQPTSSPVVNAFVWSTEMERRVRRANLQNGRDVFEFLFGVPQFREPRLRSERPKYCGDERTGHAEAA